MQRKNGGTGLFLLEMLIVILFFSLSAAICVRVFAAAKLAGQYADDLSLAAVRAESMAESFKASHGDTAEAARLFPEAVCTEDGLAAYYNGEWEQCDADEAAYTVTLAADGAEAHIDVTKNGEEPLFSLDVVALIFPEEGDAA